MRSSSLLITTIVLGLRRGDNGLLPATPKDRRPSGPQRFAPSSKGAPHVSVHQQPHVYESVSLVLEGEVDGDRFADFVESEVAQFSGRLFRVERILAFASLEARMIVQGVSDSVEVTFGEPWGEQPRTSRLVLVRFRARPQGVRRRLRCLRVGAARRRTGE